MNEKIKYIIPAVIIAAFIVATIITGTSNSRLRKEVNRARAVTRELELIIIDSRETIIKLEGTNTELREENNRFSEEIKRDRESFERRIEELAGESTNIFTEVEGGLGETGAGIDQALETIREAINLYQGTREQP